MAPLLALALPHRGIQGRPSEVLELSTFPHHHRQLPKRQSEEMAIIDTDHLPSSVDFRANSLKCCL